MDLEMGWKYRIGLLLIGAVVVIWVTSAEVTQVVLLSTSLFFCRKKSVGIPFVFGIFFFFLCCQDFRVENPITFLHLGHLGS